MRQLIIAIVIVILVIILAWQNSDMVTVKLFVWEFTQASLAIVLLITLTIGLITGMMFLAPGVYRRNQIISSQKRRILELEREITGSRKV